MNVEPFLVDPTFPQLGIAGDPESMREIFREHLPPAGKTAYHVRDCRLSRVRYRRGARCVLQYTLRLAEADTGRERTQWVTGVMYGEDVTRRKWRKLRSSDPVETPGVLSAFEPYAFIPGLGMLVEVFPYDRRLPTLPLLMAGPLPEIELPLLARFGPGDWRTEAWNVEPIRYRAELGATLRLTVRARDGAAGRSDERCFYAKVYNKNEAGERTYRTLRALRSRADEGFTVGAPVAYLGGLRTLLQEETPGVSLQDRLLLEEDATPAVRTAAEALAALHLSDVAKPRRHPLQNEVVTLERAGRLLRWACPRLGTEIEETVGAVVAGLEEVPPAPTHRDLKLDHILLDGDRAAFLDLDWFADADPLLDSASILAGLTSMPLRFVLPRGRPQAAARAFADEYFARVPRAWHGRLPTHYAGAVLKEAVGFFRRQEPDWEGKIAILVEEARNSLAGRVW